MRRFPGPTPGLRLNGAYSEAYLVQTRQAMGAIRASSWWRGVRDPANAAVNVPS